MVFVSTLIISVSGCKKCFHFYNECVLCTYADSLQMVSRRFCRDSFNTQSQFESAISADSAVGYVCSATASTYTYDFCSNQAGKGTYPDYFNQGNKIKCDEK